MALIQVPEIARKIQRRFGTDGPAPVHTVAPEIVPVAIIEDLTQAGPEDTGFLRFCIGYSDPPTPAASNYCHAQLFNPASSGVLVHLEGAYCSVASASKIYVQLYDTELSSAGVQNFRDRRLEGNPAARASRQNHTAYLGTRIAPLTLQQDDVTSIPLDILLPPGSGLVIVAASSNMAMYTVWYWSERSTLDGE